MMNKTTKYAVNGALWGGGLSALVNLIIQLSEINRKPQQKFDWSRFLGATGKGALAGGAIGLTIGVVKDQQNSKEKPIDTDAHLASLFAKIKLNKNEDLYTLLDQKALDLIEFFKLHFGGKLSGEPTRLGSTEKGTALAEKYDIDVCLTFKPGSYPSTEAMYAHVLKLSSSLVGQKSIIKVRDQKKSVGIILELRGVEYKIDVVPCKLTNKPGNETSGYLYVNDSNNPTYTKTDIGLIKGFKLSETQRKIVVLLKNWKEKNKLPLSSHLLEHLVKDAYSYNKVPRNFTKKIVMVLQHIRDNLDVAYISSVENTNNIITDISDNKKLVIIDACKRAIEEYEYQPNSIVKTIES